MAMRAGCGGNAWRTLIRLYMACDFITAATTCKAKPCGGIRPVRAAVWRRVGSAMLRGFVDPLANLNDFAFTPAETVVQINSDGAFAIKYVNPADDPSKTQ
jgi:hypothetical protein